MHVGPDRVGVVLTVVDLLILAGWDVSEFAVEPRRQQATAMHATPMHRYSDSSPSLEPQQGCTSRTQQLVPLSGTIMQLTKHAVTLPSSVVLGLA